MFRDMENPTTDTNEGHAEGRPGSVRNIVDFILQRNAEQSRLFTSTAERTARQQYRALHPTEIVVFKCMDGRLNGAVMTETPMGILQPYRNIGGKFNLGWPYLGRLMDEWKTYAVGKGRNCLIMATYHYSKGDPHRGCKGFNYDTDAARSAAAELVAQCGRVFGTPYQVVHPILVGLETDEDALVFHSEKDDVFFIADHVDMPPEAVDARLTELYPQMRPQVRKDLLELVVGNQRHIRTIREQQRKPIDLDHREQVIAIGRGFDWLHQPNLALIIGPYSGWKKTTCIAGNIILDNMQRGQLDADAEVLLFVSALSRESQGSVEWNLAVEKARYMAERAHEVLAEHVPKLYDGRELQMLTGVVDANTRLLHPCT